MFELPCRAVKHLARPRGIEKMLACRPRKAKTVNSVIK